MLHLGHKTTRPLRSPALLVLDEPCQGLDEVNRRTMLNLIHYIAESSGTTLLYVTHHATDQVPCIKRQLTMGE